MGYFDIQSVFPELKTPQQELEERTRTNTLQAASGQAGLVGSLTARMQQQMAPRLAQATGNRGMLTPQQNMVRETQSIDARDPNAGALLLEAAKKYAPERVPAVMAAMEQQRQTILKEDLERRNIESQIDNRRVMQDIDISRNALAYSKQISEMGELASVGMSTPIGSGYVQVSRTDGTTDIISPSGIVPTKDIPRVMQQIQQDEVDREIALIRARQVEGVRGGLLVSNIEQADAMRAGTNTMLEIVRAVDNGAQAGAIRSKLPTFSEHTSRLRQLSIDMGLNVIGGTTFGALSEKEMSAAFDSAIDKSLDEKVIRSMMVDRIGLQTVLTAQLESASLMLAEGVSIPEVLRRINKDAAHYRGILQGVPDSPSDDEEARREAARNRITGENKPARPAGRRGGWTRGR